MTCSNDSKAADFPAWSVGDREPPLTFTVFQPDGVTPLDLTGKTLTFEMQLANGTGSVITGACAIVGDPTLGNAKYAWAVGDLATAGDYDGEVVITYADTTQQTYPPAPWRINVRARV